MPISQKTYEQFYGHLASVPSEDEEPPAGLSYARDPAKRNTLLAAYQQDFGDNKVAALPARQVAATSTQPVPRPSPEQEYAQAWTGVKPLFSDYDAQREANESPVSTSLKRGWEGMKHYAGTSFDTATGNTEGAAQRIKQKREFDRANPAPMSVQRFQGEWDQVGDSDLMGMAGAVLSNPAGAMQSMVEQTPNSLPGLALQTIPMFAGRALMATGWGAPVGMLLQAAAAFAGNLPIESGATIEELLHKSGVDADDPVAVKSWLDTNREDLIAKGATKAGVISLVDGVAGHMGARLMAGPTARFAKADIDFMAKAGVDVKNAQAIAAARASAPYKQVMAPLAADVLKATTGAQQLMRGMGSIGFEVLGEGSGEYLGTLARDGEASIKDAVLEGVMAGGTGVAMAGAGHLLSRATGGADRKALEALAANAAVPARVAAPAAAATVAPQPNSPLTNAANAGAAAAQAQAPVAPVQQNLPQATADETLALAQQRLAAITQKANGTSDQTVQGPDGNPMVIPGRQPEFLTENEKAEKQFLEQNLNNVEALAQGYGVQIAPSVPTQSAAISGSAGEGAGAPNMAAQQAPAAPAVSLEQEYADAWSNPPQTAQTVAAGPAVDAGAALPAAPAPAQELRPDANHTEQKAPDSANTVAQQPADVSDYLAQDAKGHWSLAKPFPPELREAVIDELDRRNANTTPSAPLPAETGAPGAVMPPSAAPAAPMVSPDVPNSPQVPATAKVSEQAIPLSERSTAELRAQFANAQAGSIRNAIAEELQKRNPLVKVKDLYGKNVYVRQFDLDNPAKTQLPIYTAKGERAGKTIHRENLDPDGSKQAAMNAGDANNPLFDVVTAKDGSPFKTEAAAKRKLNEMGYQKSHSVVPANEIQPGVAGFVLKRNPIAEQIEQAREETNTTPTDAQKEVGNYKKGRVELHGLKIAIENPKGSVRSGVDPDGKAWSQPMRADYGHFEHDGEGADGDKVDVFIGRHPESTKAFVIDQKNKDGSWDEHKVVMGVLSDKEAKATYLANYENGWQGFGGMKEMTVDELKAWLKSGETKKPVAYKARVAKKGIHEITKEEHDAAAYVQEAAKTEQVAADVSPEPKKTNTSEQKKSEVVAEAKQETGSFGPILRQFRHDAQGAIAKLKELQTGEAVAALHHRDVGDIDLVWGVEGTSASDGNGLAKLIKFHPEVLDDLQGFINGLSKDEKRSGKNRTVLTADNGRAVVSLDWFGDQKTWLLTAFQNGNEAGGSTTIDTATSSAKDDTARLGTSLNKTIAQDGYGASNKLVSAERAAILREKLKKKLNGSQLNSGIDPEILAAGAELAVFHIEAGARSFAKMAKAIASDLDMSLDKLKPYLRSWYNGARDLIEDSGLSIDGMDDADAVRADLAKLGTEQDEIRNSRIANTPPEATQSTEERDQPEKVSPGKAGTGNAVDYDYKGHLIYQSEMAGGRFMVRKPAPKGQTGDLLGRGYASMEEAKAAVDAAETGAENSDKQASFPEKSDEFIKSPDGSKGWKLLWPKAQEQVGAGETATEKPGVVTLPAPVSSALQAAMDKQKRRTMRLRTESEAEGLNLEQKLAAQTKVKAADATLRAMRTGIFAAEDAAVKSLASKDIAAFAEHEMLFPEANEAIAQLIGGRAPVESRINPGEPGYTLEMADADLDAMLAQSNKNGIIEDDRLNERIKRQEKLIDALRAESPVENSPTSGYDQTKEVVNYEQTARPGSESQEALGGIPAGENGGAEGRGDIRERKPRGSKADAGGNGNADASGVQRNRGRRGRATDLHSEAPRVEPTGDLFAPQLTPAAAPANVPSVNFQITPDLELGQGSESVKFADNIAAIQTLKKIESENRRATPDEQRILARYVGWGGLANAFADDEGAIKKGWEDRAAQLQALLTPAEYKAARSSTRNAHYTSETIVRGMWDAVKRMGFHGGLALEPSSGTGNFIGMMPADVSGHFIGVEYDSLTARMAQAIYPQSTIFHAGFHKIGIPDNSFDLAIGNPPFGKESLLFQNKPELKGVSIHNQFFRASMDALKPGGIQAMVVSRYLLDSQDSSSRMALAREAKLLGAIRLPDTAFKENARTEVVTDIIFLQKHTAAEKIEADAIIDALTARPEKNPQREAERKALANQAPEWLKTVDMPDPLGGEAMPINGYFARNRHMILGVLERSGSMQAPKYDANGKRVEAITVRLDNPAELGKRLQEAITSLPSDIYSQTQQVLKSTEQRYEDLAGAMRISLDGLEIGDIHFDKDGHLVEVVEQETEGGGYQLMRRKLTVDSPWSASLMMNADGKWYVSQVKTDTEGNPVKKLDAKGKATKFNVYERKVYGNDAELASVRLGESRYERLVKLVELRDTLKEQLTLEAENADTDTMEANRRQLAARYDAFVKVHGFLNDPKNSTLISDMPDGALIQALEMSYRPELTPARAKKLGESPRPAEATKAAILDRRVVVPYSPPGTADSPADALVISMSEFGRVDLDRIADLLKTDTEGVVKALHDETESPLIFKDPELNEWQTRDQYLAGPVRRKLNAARAAGLTKNVAALEAVQPEAWTADQVTAVIGASWVPPEVYEQFTEHLSGERGIVRYAPLTNSFDVAIKNTQQGSEWATPDASLQYLIGQLLNSAGIRLTYTDSDGKTHFMEAETALAQLKAKQIADEFSDWVFQDGDRRKLLVDTFNEKFNNRVQRQYDGEHLILPGKVPDEIINMRRHQKNVIWRGIQERFLLIDHCVGAGKTFSAIARAMERRRMGLSKKPMIVVPNHMVEQFAIDAYRLYPGAKVLAAGKKDFEKSKRRALFAKVATGDWDIVIVPHSSFKFISISEAAEERFLAEHIAQAEEAIKEAEEQAAEDGHEGWRKPLSVKQAEALKVKLETKLDSLKGKEKDRLLSFEQLGVDDLTIDEAHEYKNLWYSSRLTNVRGMGDRSGSEKAYDLYQKVRVLAESPTGSVTFMTGTPISNSAVEMYTMLRYLAAKELNELGLEHFDAWRAQYVDASDKWEPTESGGLKQVTRLGRNWSNMRSLMDLYYSVTDAVTLEDIQQWHKEDTGKDFPVPKVKGGERARVIVKPTPAQDALLGEILDGFNGLEDIEDIKERNATRLRLMDRARKVSLDARAVDGTITEGVSGGKVDRAVQEIRRIYDQWTDDKGTQLVFLDRSVPKARGDDKLVKAYDNAIAKRDAALASGDQEAFDEATEALDKFDANEISELRNALNGGWNAYDEIKRQLVASGIPAKEIRFVQEASTDEQKQALFDAVNAGEVRVLIGSTQRMGAGTNVQKRLVGLHHIDVNWKPSDIEQREGRIVRQGNSLLEKYGDAFEVEILAYATERTMDAKMWDLNATKLRTINGIRKYKGEFTMEFEDEEAVGMAEIAALASGDPLLLERVKLSSEIDRLDMLKKAWNRKVWAAKDRVSSLERTIADTPARIESVKQEAAVLDAGLKALAADVETRSVSVEGTTYLDAFKAMTAAKAAIDKQRDGNEKARFSIDVNGERITSMDALDDAVRGALGDAEPFMMVLNGQRMIRRRVADKALADIANELVRGMNAEGGRDQKSRRVGEWFGLALEIDVSLRYDKYSVGLSLVDASGKTIISRDGDDIARKHIDPFSPQYLRGLMGKIDELVPAKVRYADSDVRGMESSIAKAKADLPVAIEQTKNTEFPQAAELAEKSARLEEVTQILAAKTTPAPATNADDAPLESRGDAWYSSALANTVPSMAIRAAWERAFGGKTIRQLDEKGLIHVVATAADLPAGVTVTSTAKAVWDTQTGKAYFIANRMNPATAHRELLHEIGEHAGLEQMLGVEKYDALLKRIKDMKDEGDADVNAAWAFVKRAYIDSVPEGQRREVEGSKRFMHEVLAQLGQNADIQKKPWWQAILATVRRWLIQHMGFTGMLKVPDLQTMVLHSLKTIAGPSGKPPRGGLTAEALASNKDKYEFVHHVLEALAMDDGGGLFRYPTTKAGSVVGALRDVFPGVTYLGDTTRADEMEETGADKRLSFAFPDSLDDDGEVVEAGKQFDVYVTGREVWLDIHRASPGDQGSRVYSALADFAFNTNRVFRGDPQGVSVDAIKARNKMMLASALKHFTTRHLAPSPEQQAGIAGRVPGLAWGPNDVENTRNLIHTVLMVAQVGAPALKDYRYDFAKRAFTKLGQHDAGTAGILADLASNDNKRVYGGLVRAAGGSQLKAAGLGAASGRAAILIQSLVSEEDGRVGNGGILEAALNQSGTLIDNGLRGLFSEGDYTDTVNFWRDYAAVIGRGVASEISEWLQEAYLQGRGGLFSLARRGEFPDTGGEGSNVRQANRGRESLFIRESLAGFTNYWTKGWLGQYPNGLRLFNFHVAPSELVDDPDALEKQKYIKQKALFDFSFAETDPGKFTLSVAEADPGTEAYRALEAMGRLEDTPHRTTDGGHTYKRVKLDNRTETMRQLLREAVRRLTVATGAVPEITFPRRDTGARAGREMERTYSPDEIARHYSEGNYADALRALDVFGNGSRVDYYDDAKGLMYSRQETRPGKFKWSVFEVFPSADGGEQLLGEMFAHDSLEAAMTSVRGARVAAALKARHAQRYGAIPALWDGDAKRAAKALIDAGFEIERAATSTQSTSKYLYLGNGLKVRMADHALPSSYDAADVDYRYGGSLADLISDVRAASENATAPDSRELGSPALNDQDAGAADLRADESGQSEEPAQFGGGAGGKQDATTLESRGDSLEAVASLNAALEEQEGVKDAFSLDTSSNPLVNLFDQVFGLDLVPIRSNHAQADTFAATNYDGKLYANTSHPRYGFPALAGHELLHQLKLDRPDLYRALVRSAERYAAGGVDGALRAYGARPENQGYAQSDLLEELLGDFTGDALSDRSFLRQLADEHPSLFGQFADYVMAWLDKVAQALTGKGFGSSQYFADVQAMRDALAGVLAEYALNKSNGTEGGIRHRLAVPNAAREAGKTISNLVAPRSVKNLNAWHKSVGTMYHLSTVDRDFKRVFDEVNAYVREAARLSKDAESLAPALIPQAWRAKPIATEDARKIAQPIFLGTLHKHVLTDDELLSGTFEYLEEVWAEPWIDGDDDGSPKGPHWVTRTVDFEPLTEAQLGYYRQFRRAINKSLDDLGRAQLRRHFIVGRAPEALVDEMMNSTRTADDFARRMIEVIEAEVEQGLMDEKEAALLINPAKKIGQQIEKLHQEGYAPLMRFGRYSVYAYRTEQDEETGEFKQVPAYFTLFESERERNASLAGIREALAEAYPGEELTFEEGILPQGNTELFEGMTPEMAREFAEATGMEQDAAFQAYLQLAVNNHSILKRLIHRKGTAGYSEDSVRVLASFIAGNSRRAAMLTHITRAKEFAESIPRGKGDVTDMANTLVKYVQDPQEEAGALRGLMFFQFLGGSLASAAVNLTQTVLQTAPYLYQYARQSEGGRKQLLKDLYASQRLAFQMVIADTFGKPMPTVAADMQRALDKASSEGVTKPHEVYQLMAAARGQSLSRTAGKTLAHLFRQDEAAWGAKAEWGVQRFMRAWGSLFGMAEESNRLTVFMTAFKMGRQQGMSEDAAYAAAVKAVNETQGIYGKQSRPMWARGPVGATIFTFKAFSIQYVEFLRRLYKNDKEAFFVAVALLVGLAGMTGLPGSDDLDDIIDTVGQWMGFATNTKKSRRELVEATVGRVFGQVGTDFALNGISAVLPVDVHSRLGLGNIIPGTAMLHPGKTSDQKLKQTFEVLGPVGGLVNNAFNGMERLAKGDVEHALTAIAPSAIRNAYLGGKMIVTGYAEDSKGRRVADVTLMDAAAKMMGVQPSSVAGVYDRRNEQNTDKWIYNNMRASIAEQWAEGMAHKNAEQVADALSKLRAWNRDHPDMKITVRPADVRRRANAMLESAKARQIKATPKALRPTLEESL